MTNKDTGAKQLAMYADNPVRYCNLRGQLEGPGAAAVTTDNDRIVRKDRLAPFLWALLGFSLASVTLGSLVLLEIIGLGLGYDDQLAAIVMLVLGALMGVGSLLLLLRRSRLRRVEEICRRFGLDPDEYRLVTASIMGNRGRLFRANGVSAVPHAVFLRTRGHRSHHVALLLNRPYAGRVHDSDLFRLTLQMGILRRELGVRMISGSICYAGKLVKVAYSDSLYTALQRMAGEYERSVSRWWPENRLSLRERQRVAAGEAVRAASTVDWPDEYSV